MAIHKPLSSLAASIILGAVILGVAAYVYITNTAKPAPEPEPEQQENVQPPLEQENEPGTEGQAPAEDRQPPIPPTRQRTAAGWDDYKNKRYGFQFSYPGFYGENTDNNDILSWEKRSVQAIARFSYGGTNYLYAGGFEKNFREYKLSGLPAGYQWCVDGETKKWIECHTKKPAGDNGPKLLKWKKEAYIYRVGDGECAYDIIIIPRYSPDYVLELASITCPLSARAGKINKPLFKLDPLEFLNSVKFAN